MFLLYLGEKGTEVHIVTEDEEKEGCFSLDRRAEYGCVLGLIEKDYLSILEYRTQKKDCATDEDGTAYIGYENMVRGDRVELQYVKYVSSKKEESAGKSRNLDFTAIKRDPFAPPDKRFIPFSGRKICNFYWASIHNSRFVDLLMSGEKIEVIICESEKPKQKYFIFGFEAKSRTAKDYKSRIQTDEIRGSVESAVMVQWGK